MINKIKKWQNHRGIVLDTVDEHDVIECQLCGFKHIIPLPTEQEIEKFYTDNFYDEELPDYIEKRKSDYEWWAIEQNIKYDVYEKQLSAVINKKILDIGSGPGYFLHLGKERNWTVTGFEPGKKAFNFSKYQLGLEIKNELFTKKNCTKYGFFDVVNMNNVLEHVLNPIEMIQNIHNILVSGGLISITSPNDYNPLQMIAVNNTETPPWWVVPKHHLNYFNFKNLSNLLKDTGFEIIYKTSSFPLEMFLLMGEDYIGNKDIGKKIHQKRVNFEKNISFIDNDIRKSLYEKFAELGLGRTITVIAKKI